MPFSQEPNQNTSILSTELARGPEPEASLPGAPQVPDVPKVTPRRSSRKRMCSRYLDEDMITLEDSSLWSPVLSRALQERYGDSGRKRTPRTLTRLMQQHRENERHRHHGLNASIREISQRIPGFDEEDKETKIVKLQRIINYICHLEHSIKKVCDDIGFTLDYKNLFLSPHIARNPDDWKPVTKQTSADDQYRPRQYTALCLKQHLEDKKLVPSPDGSSGSPLDNFLPQNLPPGSSCGHSPTRRRRQPGTKKGSGPRPGGDKARGKASRAKAKGSEGGTTKAAKGGGVHFNVPEVHQTVAIQDNGEVVLVPGIALDGDGNAWLNQNVTDLGQDDLAWLDQMMESSTTDVDQMCHDVIPLQDLLPEISAPPFSPSSVVNWDSFSKPSQSCPHVAEFHSYARTPDCADRASTQVVEDGDTEASEEYGVCPQTQPTSVTSCIVKELLLTPENNEANEQVNLESSDGLFPLDPPEDGQEHLSPLQQFMTTEETVLTSGEIKLEHPGHVSAGKRAEKPRADQRKTSWMNGFMMYSRLHRKVYIKENPGVHTSHISRMMGLDWRNLSSSEQQPYKEKARLHIQNHLAPQLVPNFKKKKHVNKISY